jgi:hypothetical protein
VGEPLRLYGPPVLAWVVFLVRRPGDDLARRYVRRVLLGLAISLSALTPAGHAVINGVAGTHDLPRLVGHAGMLVVAWAAQDLLAYLNGLRRSRWHTWWITGMFCVMCVLFALTPDLFPQSPWVFEYVVAYVVAQAPAFVNVIRLGLRYAAMADTASLRVALRMVAAGAFVGLVYLVNKAILAARPRFDFEFPLGRTVVVSKLLPTSAYLLVLAGAVLPVLLGWCGRYRRYRRLGPLWRDLYRADPEIALDPPSVPDLLALRHLRLRLYRRVIEIRDGLLALRPYRDPDVAAVARDRAIRAGLVGQQREAAVEAATIAAALRARASGPPPDEAHEEPVAGGDDLAAETAFLSLVARAYRPAVTASPGTRSWDRRGRK